MITKSSHCRHNYWLTLSITSVIIMSMDISRIGVLDSTRVYIITGNTLNMSTLAS